MTYAQYLQHFSRVGFTVDTHWFTKTPMSDAFYDSHYEKLSPYPRYELERNFMHVRLIKSGA